MTQEPETHSPDYLRMAEAILFAATEPLREADIASRLPDDADVAALLKALVRDAGGGAS